MCGGLGMRLRNMCGGLGMRLQNMCGGLGMRLQNCKQNELEGQLGNFSSAFTLAIHLKYSIITTYLTMYEAKSIKSTPL